MRGGWKTFSAANFIDETHENGAKIAIQFTPEYLASLIRAAARFLTAR